MNTHFRRVAQFNEMIGYTRPTGPRVGLAGASEETLESIRVMLKEELNETLAAMEAGNTVEFLDGIADLVVVAMGAAHKIGANFDVVMDRVCTSNLSKTPGDVHRGFTRDAAKGLSYVPPAIEDIDPERLWSAPDDHESGVAIPYPFLEAAGIRDSKAVDYMSGGVTREDLNPFGLPSYAHNVIEKALRIKSLVGSGRDPECESIRDSAIDLLNYTSFLVEKIDGRTVNR